MNKPIASINTGSSDAPKVTSFIRGATTSTSAPQFIRKGAARHLRAADVTAEAVAFHILDVCSENGDTVTNLKLQRLLFYAQAWHLALYGTSLFADDFQAWPNGPVNPDTYGRFVTFGSRSIEVPASGLVLTKKIQNHIRDLLQAYGRLSALELNLMVCEQQPWRDTRDGLAPSEPCSDVIPKKTIQKYYKSMLNGKKKSKTDI